MEFLVSGEIGSVAEACGPERVTEQRGIVPEEASPVESVVSEW